MLPGVVKEKCQETRTFCMQSIHSTIEHWALSFVFREAMDEGMAAFFSRDMHSYSETLCPGLSTHIFKIKIENLPGAEIRKEGFLIVEAGLVAGLGWSSGCMSNFQARS